MGPINPPIANGSHADRGNMQAFHLRRQLHVSMIGVVENHVSSEMIVDSRKTILRRGAILPAGRRSHESAAYENDERSRKQREMHASICLRAFAIGKPSKRP
jgi:hypothetical protein